MGVDLRQVVAGILTMAMFVMLGQMMRRDYIDSSQENILVEGNGHAFAGSKAAVKESRYLEGSSIGPWMEVNDELKPCWSKTDLEEIGASKGYVMFSLANGPEYHVSQVADAVVVARRLGATLVLPDIRGSRPGDERNFEDIYDVDKFIQSLDGVVKVVKKLPNEVSIRNMEVMKVPTRVKDDYILENIEPVFKSKGNIRIVTYFPSVNMRMSSLESKTDSVACLAMFDSLELQPKVKQLVDSMVERLRTLSRKSDGRFIAVDLRVDILDKNNCHSTDGTTRKNCYSAQEIAVFLRKIGFEAETTIYLTQSRWDSSLNILKDIFPRTYTKESIMPADKKSSFLDTENSEYEKVIDFYVSARSDVFIPAISGMFYANTVGKRIAMGKPQILVPAEIPGTSAVASDFLSPYVSKKNHLAYSCFC